MSSLVPNTSGGNRYNFFWEFQWTSSTLHPLFLFFILIFRQYCMFSLDLFARSSFNLEYCRSNRCEVFQRFFVQDGDLSLVTSTIINTSVMRSMCWFYSIFSFSTQSWILSILHVCVISSPLSLSISISVLTASLLTISISVEFQLCMSL